MRRPIGTDDSLLQATVHGDTRAFAELVRRHRPWVHRLLRAFTVDSDTAEDLTQETFARLHRHAGAYRSRGAFVPFLKTVALNIGRSHLRRTRGVQLVSWDEVAEPIAADIVETVLARGVLDDLRAAIEALPTPQRDALLLRFFAGLTVDEIAVRLHCPPGTVKSRLHHGLRTLREALDPERNPLP
jgi:RNA polymerase sigma-70 factor (ECF subfamily)